MLAVAVMAASAVLGAWGAPAAVADGGTVAADGPGSSGPGLSLLAPPTIAGPGSPFAVRLGLSGAVARADLSLSVSIYDKLSDPTEFDETLGGNPVGTVVAGSGGALAVSSLPSDPQGDGVDLSVPVSAGGVAGTGTGPFTADLPYAGGSYDGVYPVRFVLTDTTSGATARLFTYLVYTDPSADTERLRFALVVPLALGTPDASGGVGRSSLDTLTEVMGAIAGARSTVPLTLVPSPATVVALEGGRRPAAKAALSSLFSLTAEPDLQTLCGPFVPVNASALVTATLGGASELTEQVRRGAEVLDAVPGLHTGGCPTAEIWVANGTLDPAALDALDSLGYRDVVVPPSAVSGPTPAITPTRLFTWSGTARPGTGVLSDPSLSSRLQSTARTDPALAADQLLAELELDYYEAPNTAARGVVAVPPANWHADSTVLADVLDGLENNPMVEPVTLTTLFSEVPVGGTTGRFIQPSSHRPAGSGASGLPTQSLAAARRQWTGLSAAVSSGSAAGATVAATLDDLLLEAESQQLTSSQQRAAVRRYEDAFGHQLALLSITSREVRLTARTGSVPITVVKSAPYPVQAVLTVTSDKIAFSAGGPAPNTECSTPVVTNSAGRSSVSSLCTFIHGTNPVYIEMRSRVSGDFRMSVTLDSPQGALELASGQITVRSLSTSAAAIGLSVAAGAVLLGWWGRTVWRSRRDRRGAHRQRARPS
jgi:hypothetical protein